MYNCAHTIACNGQLVLHTYVLQLRGTIESAIEAAERDRQDFDAWKAQSSGKAASGVEPAKDEMVDIVNSEETELDVIKSYCEKDVKKISECDQQWFMAAEEMRT